MVVTGRLRTSYSVLVQRIVAANGLHIHICVCANRQLGTFVPASQTFTAATIRVTRTEYDGQSRPVTVTQNYRPELPVWRIRRCECADR